MESEEEEEAGTSVPAPAPSGSSQSRDEDVDTSDPVIAGLRTSMDNLLQLVGDIIPTCYSGKIRKVSILLSLFLNIFLICFYFLPDEKKSEVVERMKSIMLRLIKSELTYVEGLKMIETTEDSISDIEEDADDHAILAHCELLKTVNTLAVLHPYINYRPNPLQWNHTKGNTQILTIVIYVIE